MNRFISTLLGLSCLLLSLGSSEAAPKHQPHIVWNKNSLNLVARGGNYGRIIRLRNGRLLSVYERGRRVQSRQSRDNGKSWEKEVEVASSPLGSLANPEALQTRGGAILVFSNLRPSPNQDPAPNYAICLSRSEDGGQTFGALTTLFRAGTTYGDGCREPAAVQLPSGEIQLFFADESPYTKTDEQQITMMRSPDEGQHWMLPEAVSLRAGHRDGMPVPARLSNGDVAFAIEDNGLSGTFKPSIVHTTRKDHWRTGPVLADSPNRWGALLLPLDARVYAGAPYLRVLRSGETVLSFQQADDGDMQHSQMTVCIGDAGARNFRDSTKPFGGFSTGAQLWNSVFVKDKDTVTALSSTRIGGISGVWAIDGKMVR